MKIVVPKKPEPTLVAFTDIKPGDVFRHADHDFNGLRVKTDKNQSVYLSDGRTAPEGGHTTKLEYVVVLASVVVEDDG